MAWASSKVFTAFVKDALDRTSAFDLDTDIPKVALYNNTTAPDNTVTSANSAYAVGQWVVGNEVSHAGQWAAGGVVLASHDVTSATTTITYDAADTASGSAATLAAVFGCLVHDDTLTTPVADQGICYNYFGGTQSVTAGTFTVVWHANGIFTISVA